MRSWCKDWHGRRAAQEVWFATADAGWASTGTLMALSLSGTRRVVDRFAGSVTLHDIAADGRVLLTADKIRRELMLVRAGSEENLTWLDYSFPRGLSADGRQVLLLEGGGSVGRTSSLWLRAAGDAAAVRQCEGDNGSSLSPDGKWVAALRASTSGEQLYVVPTFAGEERRIELHALTCRGCTGRLARLSGLRRP